MLEISDSISSGTQAFIRRESLNHGICVVGIAALMGIFLDYHESITFLLCVAASAMVCRVGISISTQYHCRGCNLAVTTFSREFKVAYSARTMMGMCVIAVGVLNIDIIYAINPDPRLPVSYAAAMFLGYSLGPKYVGLPLLLVGIGILCSMIGAACVRVGEAADRPFEQRTQTGRHAINRGLIISNVSMIVAPALRRSAD